MEQFLKDFDDLNQRDEFGWTDAPTNRKTVRFQAMPLTLLAQMAREAENLSQVSSFVQSLFSDVTDAK